MKYDNLKIAKILKERRLKYDISTRQLSELVGVSHSEISRIENGQRINYNLEILNRMCCFLGIDMKELLKISEIKNTQLSNKYKITFKKNSEEDYYIIAKTEEEAVEKLYEYLLKHKKILLNSFDTYFFEVSKKDDDFQIDNDIEVHI